MSEQLDLFGAHARRTDPDTSHDAAASLTDLRRRQAAVFAALLVLGPSTDERLVESYDALVPRLPQSPSGIRTRRSELVARGLVHFTGDKQRIASGRLARIWEAVL